MKTIFLQLICITLLGACGHRGPLFLPEEKPATGQAAPDKDAEKARDKEKKKDTGRQPAINH